MGLISLSVLGLVKEFLAGDSKPGGGERGTGCQTVKLDEDGRIKLKIIIKKY